jgi:hypothetical protein
MKPIRGKTVMKKLQELSVPINGSDTINYAFKGLDFFLDYELSTGSGSSEPRGSLRFEFVIGLCIESENNRGGLNLPEQSHVLYGFATDVSEGFKGYQVWFVDNQLVTVICEKAFIGDKEV